MSIRVNKILSDTNIGLKTLQSILGALGYNAEDVNLSTKVSDEIAENIRKLCKNDFDFLALLEESAQNEYKGEKKDPDFPLKIVGKIDLDKLYGHTGRRSKQQNNFLPTTIHPPKTEYENAKIGFWIDELLVLSPIGKVKRIKVGEFESNIEDPMYSVLIGINGIGKSTLLKEVVDFFVDLYSCANVNKVDRSLSKQGQVRGIKYHINGMECEVIRLSKSYLAKINGQIAILSDLKLPSLVACNFGAFDKFPIQRVNGYAQTRYDVPFYKYVGAHVNGNMISSSAIVFRMLFALSENMNDRQRQNILSTLDFVGYDHKISLAYTFVMNTRKNGTAMQKIIQRVYNDREYKNLTKQELLSKSNQLYNFYKEKTSTGNNQFVFEIDIDNSTKSEDALKDLQIIYKLKQYELVNSMNCKFHKNGCEVMSDDLSSGEFALISIILSISAAVSNSNALILLDEPELSLHPNWQMSLIDNLNRALKGLSCHLIIATHSHMIVSDLPLKRSSVIQLENDKNGELIANMISESTYGWSAEEVLLKVFRTATDRNRYFGERIGNLLEQMGNNSISPEKVADELNELQEISQHLSDIDPMKMVLNTIIKAYK